MTGIRSTRRSAPRPAAGEPFALEFRVLHADGSVRWVLERGVKTIDRDGSEWLDGIIFDITERRASEQLRLARETEAARIEELEASRARIIEASDAARRRIERDLHDGAQQRLVVASLKLRAAEQRTQPGTDAAAMLAAARAELDGGLAELRELARGIHPTVLTTLGLIPAVEALATRSAVPVELDDDARRPAPARSRDGALLHRRRRRSRTSTATRAHRMRRCGSGATATSSRSRSPTTAAAARTARAGPGLRGLADRLSTVNGELELESPPGGGTRLRVRVPLD